MNIKYFLPAIIVAIIIAIFSTILPAQGGFPKSNPSTLTGAYVQVQHSTGTTGVLLDSLKNTTAVGISDGDKTDVDVTGNGTMWTIDTSAINWTKLTQAVKDSITQDLSNFIIQNKTGFFTYTKPSGDIIYQSYTPILYTGVNPATIGGSTTTYMYAVDTIGTDTIYVNNNNVWERFEATAIVAGSPRPDTIEATIYHTAVGSTIQVGTSEFFQAVPSEWNGGVITKVHYQQFVTGANVTNVGLKITANGGGVTTPFTGSIAIGDKYKTVTGSTSLATGDAIQVDVPSGTPDGQGLVAVLKIVMP